MTHGDNGVHIYDDDTGAMHQFQNIYPVTRVPDPNNPGPFDRVVPPMNFTWLYACTCGNDGNDWRIKLE